MITQNLRKGLKAIAVLTWLICFCGPLNALTIRVPYDQPTIQAGIDAASNSDTVMVADGTYFENVNFVGKAIVVKSENGPQRTIIEIAVTGAPLVSFQNGEGLNSILEGFTIDGDSSYWGVYAIDASPYIYNNIIKNHEVGIRIDNGAPVIRKNEIFFCDHIDIEPCNGGGIRIYSGSGVVIDSNIIHENWSNVAGGIYLYNVDNSSIRRNLIHTNSVAYTCAIGLDFCDRLEIENNTLANNTRNGEYMGAIGIHDCHYVDIINNIIYANNDWGIHAWEGSSDNFADYNAFFDNSYGDIFGIDNIGEHNIFADPLFINSDNHDYRLALNSPCIDAGDPESPLDPDGSRADMGALFFGIAPGELSLDIADIFGEQGSGVEAPVYANGFANQDVAGVELHISYNPDCLTYSDISSDYLTEPLVNVENGQINILWEDYQNLVVIADGTALISIHFELLADIGDTCVIEWLDNCEIADPQGEIVTGIEYLPGSVISTTLSALGGQVIYYDMTTAVPGVTVELTGDQTGEGSTNAYGTYAITDLPPGSYTLCPAKGDNDDGITVNDVVLIRRHIVQLEEFDSPYKMIAADVNKNHQISVADVIKIRRYLALIEELPSGNWTFTDADFAISFDNWFNAPGCIDTILAHENIDFLDFIGIRMGDVDMSYCCEDRGLTCLDDSVTVTLNTVACHPGDIINVPITVEGFAAIAGLEIHIDYSEDMIDFVQLHSELLADPTINGSNGNVHLVWEDIENLLTVDDGTEILQIEFQVAENAPDTIPITFSRIYVCDEHGDNFAVGTYDGRIITGPTGIDDNGTALPTDFLLKQNYPNPFNATTSFELQMPQPAHVSLIVYDIQGRVAETLFGGELPAGIHHIKWDASGYPSGIYIYKLQTGEYTQTKKMLLLK